MGILFGDKNPKEKEHSGLTGLFSADLIKWEPESGSGLDIIAYKFPYEDFPNHSQLIVAPSQIAVFVNNMQSSNSTYGGDGQAQISVFVGPCRIQLETGNSRFAPFRRISNSLTDGQSAFHCTVYFINTTYFTDLRWGTKDPILVEDPQEQVNVHVRAYGLFGVHIEHLDETKCIVQAMKFLRQVVGTKAAFTKNDLLDFTRAKILEYVPTLLAQKISDENISVLKISTKLKEFSSIIHNELISHFDNFGLSLDNFSFHNINVPDEDLSAINDMKIKRKQNEYEAKGNAMKIDIESEALARKRAREGYSYQQEKAFDVMSSAAQNEGTPSTFMGAGIGLGAGFGIGGAIGNSFNNMANSTMNTVMGQNTASAANSFEESIICPSCNTKLKKDSKFCIECGTKISQNKICPGCNSQVSPTSKFCPECGHNFMQNTNCPNCGSKIENGMKFCVECGNKL